MKPSPKSAFRGKLTGTQIGTIGEVTVATQLMLTSNGRFSPFLPMADDDGIDLLIYDKVTGVSLPIQVKSRMSASLGESDTIVFDIRLKTFRDRPDAFVLTLLLETGSGQILRAWLIPMSELEAVSRKRQEKLSITPSAKSTSKDRYTPYRCPDMAEVSRRLESYLDTRK